MPYVRTYVRTLESKGSSYRTVSGSVRGTFDLLQTNHAAIQVRETGGGGGRDMYIPHVCDTSIEHHTIAATRIRTV